MTSVARTARGDKIAFTQLVARHRRRLLALVARMLGDRAAAEDIVQDVFTRAWTHAANWRTQDAERASYASWLSRVAINRAIDQTRRKRPQPSRVFRSPRIRRGTGYRDDRERARCPGP